MILEKVAALEEPLMRAQETKALEEQKLETAKALEAQVGGASL